MPINKYLAPHTKSLASILKECAIGRKEKTRSPLALHAQCNPRGFNQRGFFMILLNFDKINELLNLNNLTVKAFCEGVGISHANFYKKYAHFIEVCSGHEVQVKDNNSLLSADCVKLSAIEEIANYFKVSPFELICSSDTMLIKERYVRPNCSAKKSAKKCPEKCNPSTVVPDLPSEVSAIPEKDTLSLALKDATNELEAISQSDSQAEALSVVLKKLYEAKGVTPDSIRFKVSFNWEFFNGVREELATRKALSNNFTRETDKTLSAKIGVSVRTFISWKKNAKNLTLRNLDNILKVLKYTDNYEDLISVSVIPVNTPINTKSSIKASPNVNTGHAI